MLVSQLQPEAVQTVQQHVSYECDYIELNVHYCVLFSVVGLGKLRVRSRVRIRVSVWLVSCYAHVFVLLSTVIVSCHSAHINKFRC